LLKKGGFLSLNGGLRSASEVLKQGLDVLFFKRFDGNKLFERTGAILFHFKEIKFENQINSKTLKSVSKEKK
jgi:hypothetical protein